MGPSGPPGPTGAPGLQGPPGIKGGRGKDGTKGEPVSCLAGILHFLSWCTTDLYWNVDIRTIQAN